MKKVWGANRVGLHSSQAHAARKVFSLGVLKGSRISLMGSLHISTGSALGGLFSCPIRLLRGKYMWKRSGMSAIPNRKCYFRYFSVTLAEERDPALLLDVKSSI